MSNERKDFVQRELFAAANSGRGFANFYKQVFWGTSIEHRYLIKGGPGTGKSTFMRKIAQKATDKGLEVEYYRCSSDPESLDAVVVAGRVAIMDATSPHCVDAELAGAVDELVDLGAFWDSEGLWKELPEIKRLCEEKKRAYKTAYRFLCAAMELEDGARAISQSFLNKEKMAKAAKRMASKLADGGGFEMRAGLRDSIGMKGRVKLDFYELGANRVYYIGDYFKLGSTFISMLAEEAIVKGNKITVSYCPLNPTHPDAILFEDDKTAFVLTEEKICKGANKINMKRFFNRSTFDSDEKKSKRLKNEYRTNVRICDGLIENAIDALKSAGEYHFELEKIYKRHMDFEKQSEFCENFASALLERFHP